ncbi:multidrug effflux MFS transporter [uncultured Sphingomonas sp.]|uniref:multidrug effflux MFS transporter n=1 Tax=uncultured Sphingomonas sp. TaxID=158754 RepID=UPI0035CC6F97
MQAPAASIDRSTDTSPLPFLEFLTLIAALMALAALGIDSMLPALGDIATHLGVARVGDRPLVITTFVVGLGVGQLIHGPLTDRFGRRPVMIAGLGGFVAAMLLCAVADSFALLLAARFAGGLACAAARVVTVALVRDCFSGRAMARVNSLAFMTFMIVPILAPTLGQVVMLVGSWRTIFVVVAGIALAVLIWFARRMPETHVADSRQPLSFSRIGAGWRVVLGDRLSIGYALAATAMQGAIFGYLSSIQPIMELVFKRPEWLAGVFAISAGLMAVANLANARIVMLLGMRRIAHGALIAMLAVSIIAAAVSRAGAETLPVFVALQGISMASFSLAGSNMSTLAMENMGRIAGTASSVQGFLAITLGAVFGTLIGRAFDGTTMPLHVGFALTAMVALAITAWVERGRLFRTA